ncbi:hypothetical protein [Candidatus Protochlamydia phocaeensis]|uniref:hypothetical protein n=1 Tax=Candidatus Protochlamydia phocaeensis TaxID=1414722 RepID=UPI000838FFB6|nr:hypothetical protein [Candidatus Protochlamydia phocaeensis]
MNSLLVFYNQTKSVFSEYTQDIIGLVRPVLVPNSTRISQSERKFCLIAGAGTLAGIIALKAFTAMSWQTFKILATVCAVPLIGGLTGIPLFVYIGCAITPPLVFITTAVAFSVIYPHRGV